MPRARSSSSPPSSPALVVDATPTASVTRPPSPEPARPVFLERSLTNPTDAVHAHSSFGLVHPSSDDKAAVRFLPEAASPVDPVSPFTADAARPKGFQQSFNPTIYYDTPFYVDGGFLAAAQVQAFPPPAAAGGQAFFPPPPPLAAFEGDYSAPQLYPPLLSPVAAGYTVGPSPFPPPGPVFDYPISSATYAPPPPAVHAPAPVYAQSAHPLGMGQRRGRALEAMLRDGKVPKSWGTVKFFDVGKGFGFIVDNQFADLPMDVFAHYTGISQSHGFRCLAQGEPVEYYITRTSTGKLQALHITGVNGGPLRGLSDPTQAAAVRRSSRSSPSSSSSSGDTDNGSGGSGGGGSGPGAGPGYFFTADGRRRKAKVVPRAVQVPVPGAIVQAGQAWAPVTAA
ncbi:hypothetical protein JCM10207_007048 [Rhodosporidiobolus poonsookiae]